jgi:hypothetical protein
MKKIIIIPLLPFASLANAQLNNQLAKTTDRLYEADRSVQLVLKAMYEYNTPPIA